MELKNYASNGKANAALATGIIGTALGALNSGGGILGMIGGNRWGNGSDAMTAAAILATANSGWCGGGGYGYGGYGGNGWYGGRVGECGENTFITRYELNQQKENIALEAKIAEKDSQIALRDANTYADQKLLEVYKYFDGQLKDVRGELCRQAVFNQKTEDSFALVAKDVKCCCDRLEVQIARERDERKCADNSIITYTNATFYPKMVADVTTGTTTTAQSIYNPLPNCGGCNCGNN